MQQNAVKGILNPLSGLGCFDSIFLLEFGLGFCLYLSV
jgi:hypothetical protein